MLNPKMELSQLVVALHSIYLELQAEFPTTSFKMTEASTNDDVRISWEDGPTTEMVRALIFCNLGPLRLVLARNVSQKVYQEAMRAFEECYGPTRHTDWFIDKKLYNMDLSGGFDLEAFRAAK